MAILATIAKPAYNNIITANPTGSTYAYSASTGVLDANFAGTIGTTDSIQIFTQGYQFAWKPDTVNVIDDTDVMTLLENVNPNATAQVWNNKLTYVGTTASTSDEFVVDGNQLKHSVRMVAPPRLPSGFTGMPKYLAIGGDIGTTAQDWADIELIADGESHLTDFSTSDDLKFCLKDTGAEVYRIPHITITDNEGNETSGQYKLVFNANDSVTMYMLCPWDWLQQAQYPIIIDPTVIVSSAYDTSGNGGRKIVHLSNGWIVVGAYSSTTTNVYFYVSKDNGQTWSQLCYFNIGNSGTVYFAMASSGTTVYALFSGSAGTAVPFSLFDATTVTNTSALLVNSDVDSSQSAMGSVSIAVDGSGNLHASWSSKNSTYANSFNIRYSKGTVSGTTVTWASPTQLTTGNGSGLNYTNPCIVINSSNNPIIFTQYANSTNYGIGCLYWNGTSWNGTGSNNVYAPGNYTQSNPCAAIDSSGVIHVVWQGIDSAKSTSYTNILYSKSTDGGSTWSAMYDITGTQVNQSISAPSITINESNNDLYVFYCSKTFQSDTYTNIQFIKYTGGAWGGSNAITSNTTNNATNPQTLWSEFNMNSSDAVRLIYSDAQAGAVEYYSITLNSPPNAPTLTPHANFDATVAQNLTWTFSDPDAGNTQSAYELQIVDVSTSTTVVDTGKVASTTSSYTLSANTLSQNKNYQWRVATWDNNGAQGPYSAYSTFSTAAAPTVTVTTPASGGTVNSSQLTVQFSYSDPASNAQQSYEVELLQSNDSTVIEDSGTINGTNNAYTLQTVLANNTTYHARVRATNSKGVTSPWSDVSFSTSFTLPQQPSVTASSLSTDAKITIAMTNYASTNIARNSGFEDVTTTATLFSDALTSYTGSTVPAPWTLQSGSFTFGAGGATSGTNSSQLTAGNSAWKPLLGTDGVTKLVLKASTTFTMPATVPTSDAGHVRLWIDSNNYYQVNITATNIYFNKKYGGTTSALSGSGTALTVSPSTAYTLTLSLDPSGIVTATITPSGGSTTTLTYTDSSPLTGGFLIGVGGDIGVVISNASVTAPWANSWTIGGDSRVAWGLTQSAIGGKYSVSAVGVHGLQGWANGSSTPLSSNATYTLSGYMNTTNVGSGGAYVQLTVATVGSNKTSFVTGTTSTQRYSSSPTTGGAVTSGNMTVQINDSGTVTFDNIQLEQGSTATPYIENDSTSSPQQAPAIAYNDVYRRNTGTSAWTRIATNVNPSGTYDDYAVASGQGYDYKVTAIGNNGTQVDSTIVTNKRISLTNTGLWVHDVNNPSGTLMNLQYYNASTQSADGSVPQDRKWTPAATSMQFAGRNRPVIEFGENDTFELSYKNVVMLATDGQWPILEDLIRVNKSTLCFRDGRGTMIFGCVLGYQETDLVFGNMVDLKLEQTAYTLAV